MNDINEHLAELFVSWDDDPVQGVRELFGVEPTGQQIDLIEKSWKTRARVAVSSCTGAGKTSALCWITFLLLLVKDDCRVLVTSPSFSQLTRVFYSELLKWRGQMFHKDIQAMFKITRESVTCHAISEVKIANMVTASADNPESLAGGHAKNYIILADEASGIPEVAFDYLIGTLSVGNGGTFIMTSNPTRSSGRFYELFHKKFKAWKTMYFEAKDVPHIDQQFIDDIVEMYGMDSDQYRIRVMGRFPRAATTQFISTDIVEASQLMMVPRNHYENFERLMGIDVARFGDDETVIVIRQGPKLLYVERYHGKDTMEIAALAHELQGEWQCKNIYVDGIGLGAGVVDRLGKNGLKLPVQDIIVSMKSTKPLEYVNIRSQLWGNMKSWLQNGGDIPAEIEELGKQLVGMTYGYNAKLQIQLTTKKDLKKQGMPSPDIADALALTMADSIFRPMMSTACRVRQIRKRKRVL